MDASPGGNQNFPIYPEAKMHHALWARWLPEHSDRDAAQGSRGRSREVIFNLRITLWSGVTQVPYENRPRTADGIRGRGRSGPGIGRFRTIFSYGDHKVDRSGSPFLGGVTLRMSRTRPPRGTEQEGGKSH